MEDEELATWLLRNKPITRQYPLKIHLLQFAQDFDIEVDSRWPKEEIADEIRSYLYQHLDECPSEWKKIIQRDTYPCRKKFTVFNAPAEYLDWIELRQQRGGEYPKTERRERAIRATQALKPTKRRSARRVQFLTDLP